MMMFMAMAASLNIEAGRYMAKKILEISGEGGIRTLGGPKDHNGFRDRPIRPLWHLSAADYNGTTFFTLWLSCYTEKHAFPEEER
jgi:hypothetical protein